MSLLVRKPGLFTTIQDLGRPGHGRWGVSPCGAMDPLALALANLLAGNDRGAVALEVTASGPELMFEEEATFALAGADLGATLGGTRLFTCRAHRALAGQVLRFGGRLRGARAYMAVAGGLDASAQRFLGSAATDIEARLGGLSGRPLRARETLVLAPQPPFRALAAEDPWEPIYEPAGVVRFVPEPGAGLPADSLERFVSATFLVSPRSNRTGYRLEGPALPTDAGGSRLSEPVAPGTIQVPPDGQPIVLLSDRQTTGGYPRLGHVLSADIPRLAQLWLGDVVTFRAVTLDEARQALREQRAWLEGAVK